VQTFKTALLDIPSGHIQWPVSHGYSDREKAIITKWLKKQAPAALSLSA
jgi:hypothetical protein